jgi:putative ABC transport system permease protein
LFATRSGVLVSRGQADRLGLEPGDTFPLITPPGTRADGAPSWELHVLAVVPDDPRMGRYILGNFNYVDQARPAGQQGYAMGFRVAIRDGAEGNEISLRIDRGLANSSTPTLTIPDRANEVNAVNSSISVSSRTLPVAGAGVFMILLLIANGVAQSVRERTPEFAVLQTLGYRPVTLMILVFAEVAIPCLAGALVGTALAAAFTLLPEHYLSGDLAMPAPTFSWVVLAWVLGCAVLLALASAAIPVRRLQRLSVTDALAGR